MTMKPRGEDTASAVREWVRDEIKKGPASQHDLGKFFFGVSSGTAGVLVGLEKLSGIPAIDLLLGLSLGFLLLSVVVALRMAMPRRIALTGETDLYELHELQIRETIARSWFWFAMWLLGVTLGVLAVTQA